MVSVGIPKPFLPGWIWTVLKPSQASRPSWKLRSRMRPFSSSQDSQASVNGCYNWHFQLFGPNELRCVWTLGYDDRSARWHKVAMLEQAVMGWVAAALAAKHFSVLKRRNCKGLQLGKHCSYLHWDFQWDFLDVDCTQCVFLFGAGPCPQSCVTSFADRRVALKKIVGYVRVVYMQESLRHYENKAVRSHNGYFSWNI